jgi:hypothetical protein
VKRWAIIACLALGGCQHASPEADKPGALPVAVSCVPAETPPKPDVHTPEQLAKVPDGPTRYVMAAADYLKLWAWSLTAGPTLEGCRNAAPP